MTDALAVYDLFIRLDQRFQTDDFQAVFDELTPIFYAMETGRDQLATYENIVNIFGELFVDNFKAISGSQLGVREDLYKAINEIRDKISDKSLHVTSLVNHSESEIVSLAKEQNESGLATRYALVNLNSFTITGQSGLYDKFNTNGEFDICSETNRDGDLSSKYIEDRAKFLYYLAHPDATVSSFESDIDFVDTRLGVSLEVDNGMNGVDADRQYLFGNLEGELLSGYSASDHLYGMGGNDTLSGKGGDDYLEGGQGQDTLNGGAGDDTFGIIGEDDAYDTFNGGDGTDTIKGSAGNDVIRVHQFNPSNSIEQIIGGGGVDIVAGTDEVDTIDLSKTTLTDISRIEGGGGADIIKGTAAADVLYGGSEDTPEDAAQDRLEGGKGLDEYHIGAGDVIYDSDNKGIIWFEGKKLSSLVLSQVAENAGCYETSDKSTKAVLDETTGTLTVSAGDNPASFFSIENFTSGNFGITLAAYTPPSDEFDITLTGTIHRDEMGFLAVGSNPAYWHLLFASFPNGTSSSTPFYDHLLPATAPSLQISGGESGDFLFGFVGHDYIEGGGGNDMITGNLGWWNGKPLYESDALAGDTLDGGAGNDIIQSYDGNDRLFGDAGNDVLAGGSHDVVLAGGDGDDALFGDVYFTWSGLVSLGFSCSMIRS
jgi:Ca2+-binding RTX toxin-like protein